MDSRSAITSNGVRKPPQPLMAQPASSELKNPLAQPEPVGQKGCKQFYNVETLTSSFTF